MFYLIYVSTATKAIDNNELLSLLKYCRKANINKEVTGMLLYKNGCFMQMIEGEEVTIKELYKEICQDGRHQGQYVVMSGTAEKRAFNNWSMGLCSIGSGLYYGSNNDVETPYDEYIDDMLMHESFPPGSNKAYEFISQFNHLNR